MPHGRTQKSHMGVLHALQSCSRAQHRRSEVYDLSLPSRPCCIGHSQDEVHGTAQVPHLPYSVRTQTRATVACMASAQAYSQQPGSAHTGCSESVSGEPWVKGELQRVSRWCSHDIVRALACFVSLEQLLRSRRNKPLSTHLSRLSDNTSPSIIELLQAFLKHLLILILLHECVSLLQLIDLGPHGMSWRSRMRSSDWCT